MPNDNENNSNALLYIILGLLGVGGVGGGGFTWWQQQGNGVVDPTTQALTAELAMQQHDDIREEFTRRLDTLTKTYLRGEIERMRASIRFYDDVLQSQGHLTLEQEALYQEKLDQKKRLEDDLHQLERTP